MEIKIALVGDFSEDVTAHRAINASLAEAGEKVGLNVTGEWIPTDQLEPKHLARYRGIWCVPASPYKNTDGALSAIRHARECQKPFLGTCGGYQHAALEYARHVLDYPQADNTETHPNCEMPLISGLTCRLVEQTDKVFIQSGTKLAAIYRTGEADEEYHCSYGIAKDYLGIFTGGPMIFSARDGDGEPKALELQNHPFFIGTAFQPERKALTGGLHPVVEAFFRACL